MPGYRVHLAGGVGVFVIGLYLLRAYCLTYNTGIEWLCCSLAGSLFPDIDIKSKGQHYFYWFIFFLFGALVMYQKYKVLSCVSMLAITPLLVRHRGIFHKPWFVVCAPLMGWCLLSHYQPFLKYILFFDTIFFIGGALSHIWLDVGLRRMLRI